MAFIDLVCSHEPENSGLLERANTTTHDIAI
jgi:hypothetical protein